VIGAAGRVDGVSARADGGSAHADRPRRRVARSGFRAMAVALAGWLAALALVLAPTTAAPTTAASVSFDAPTASGTLGESITFSETFVAPSAPQRVELLRADTSLGGDLVTEATVTPLGGGRYRATVEETEHVLPNTTIDYRFRVRLGGADEAGPTASFTLQDTRYDWQVRSGQHVRLHWYVGDTAFAERAIAGRELAFLLLLGLLLLALRAQGGSPI